MSLLNNHLKGKEKKKGGATNKPGLSSQNNAKANTKAVSKNTRFTGGSQRGS